MPEISDYKKLFTDVSSLLEEARRRTVRQINTVITQTYWEIGRLIVEEEQKGSERAKYREYLINRLSNDLTKQYKRGFSETNLKMMRTFYLKYPHLGKSQTLSDESVLISRWVG